MKYYNLLFSKENFFKNIGIYIFISILIIYIISLDHFYIKGYPFIYHKLNNIIENKNNIIKIKKNIIKVKQ